VTVLPDSSIWVEYLRRGQQGTAWHLDALLRGGEVGTCGPVAAELIAGAASADRDELWSSLRALPWSPLGPAEWRLVGSSAGLLRDHGLTVALTDIEIAVSATAARFSVWTRDSDFRRVATILPDLKLYDEP